MKRFWITVNKRRYEVEVEEILEGEPLRESCPVRGLAKEPCEEHAGSNLSTAPGKGEWILKDSKVVFSPINGVVLEVLVQVGQRVREKDLLVVLEAMKMKTNVWSPRSGRIESIRVRVGEPVETGAVLVTFE